MNDTGNQTTFSCSNDFPSTEHLYKELLKDVAVLVLTVIAGLCTLATICIYIEEVWFLHHNYKHRSKRTRICCILALYPAVSFASVLILLVPTSTVIGEFVASVYMSFCIVQFVVLIFEYFGGEQELLRDFEDEYISFRSPPCCCCCFCLNKFPFNKCSVRAIKIMVIQAGIVRPVILFVAAVLWTDGHYLPGNESNPQSSTMYINIINVTSALFSMYGMLVTYRATAERLKNYRLGLKFGSLQLAIVIIQLQTSVLSIFGKFGLPPCSGIGSSLVRSSRTNHFLITIEMLLIAIMARFAYRRVDTDVYVVKGDHNNENGENNINGVQNVTSENELSGSYNLKDVNTQNSVHVNLALDADVDNDKMKEVAKDLVKLF